MYTGFWWGKPEEKYHMEVLDVDGWTILKLFLISNFRRDLNVVCFRNTVCSIFIGG
jgi:hypothetical protein